ncbi:MAG: polysaccharide biosynthesis/export family protein [Pyrinomonadaceae bacterium]|nr:polysaccharide biosynthesis/export family protein [Pyrinomonadaceae bacterium]
MKKALFPTTVLLCLSLPLCTAQAQNKEGRANFPPNPSAVSSKSSNKAKPNAVEVKDEKQDEKQAANHPSTATTDTSSDSTQPGTATTDAPVRSVNSIPFVSLGASDSLEKNSEPVKNTEPVKTPETKPEANPEIKTETTPDTETDKVSETDKTSEPKTTSETVKISETPDPSKPAPAPASIYRVGIGDVLDIQLLNSPSRESTLYTVLAGGMLDYPLAGEALNVAGLTTDEIGAQLTSKVKLYDNPKVAVTVREYASHNVIITGLVHEPGTKALRREAMPLFVILAEAQPRADAARAIIMRTGSPTQTIDLTDTTATSTLIYPNDVIRLVGAPPSAPKFFFIGGQVASPGQKDFHQGLTLTQAILASGGMTRFAGSKAKVLRQGTDGRLVTTEYNLKKIEQGKDPDPLLEAGDRIEISRGGW